MPLKCGTGAEIVLVWRNSNVWPAVPRRAAFPRGTTATGTRGRSWQRVPILLIAKLMPPNSGSVHYPPYSSDIPLSSGEYMKGAGLLARRQNECSHFRLLFTRPFCTLALIPPRIFAQSSLGQGVASVPSVRRIRRPIPADAGQEPRCRRLKGRGGRHGNGPTYLTR